MNRFLRYLRIAFSATCLIACVLLIALWVRSYWRVDSTYLQLNPNSAVRIFTINTMTYKGRISLSLLERPVITKTFGPPNKKRLAIADEPRVGWRSPTIEEHYAIRGIKTSPNYPMRFQYISTPSQRGIVVPIWFLILGCGIALVLLSASLPRRFSLRTLLIVTTVIALALGAIVFAVR